MGRADNITDVLDPLSTETRKWKEQHAWRHLSGDDVADCRETGQRLLQGEIACTNERYGMFLKGFVWPNMNHNLRLVPKLPWLFAQTANCVTVLDET